MHRCEGMCDCCRGDVRAVTVYDPSSLREWGLYFYCESAVEEEKRRGFDVSRVINESVKCYSDGF
jgi:hypothetical protein